MEKDIPMGLDPGVQNSVKRGEEVEDTSPKFGDTGNIKDRSTQLHQEQIPINAEENRYAKASTSQDSNKRRIDKLDTTKSNKYSRKVRARDTTKWICMFHMKYVMDHTEPCVVEIREQKDIEDIDKCLVEFFSQYNENAKKKMAKVKAVLGSRYVYHTQEQEVIGVTVIESDKEVNSLSLNRHLLVEKYKPTTSFKYEGSHTVYIGHNYPIHTKDKVERRGNSLRQLLQNWTDETFFSELHCVLSSQRDKVSDYVLLIKAMKDFVLGNTQKKNSYMKHIDDYFSPIKR